MVRSSGSARACGAPCTIYGRSRPTLKHLPAPSGGTSARPRRAARWRQQPGSRRLGAWPSCGAAGTVVGGRAAMRRRSRGALVLRRRARTAHATRETHVCACAQPPHASPCADRLPILPPACVGRLCASGGAMASRLAQRAVMRRSMYQFVLFCARLCPTSRRRAEVRRRAPRGPRLGRLGPVPSAWVRGRAAVRRARSWAAVRARGGPLADAARPDARACAPSHAFFVRFGTEVVVFSRGDP